MDVAELPIAVLLLPGALESFILRDQARDLLRAPGVVAVEPPRARYGIHTRMPFLMSEALARLEREAGRGATVLTSAADSFPAPDPTGTVVALSLGHLGHRVDWALLRELSDRLGERLVCLLVGDVHPEELKDDPDFAAC